MKRTSVLKRKTRQKNYQENFEILDALHSITPAELIAAEQNAFYTNLKN